MAFDKTLPIEGAYAPTYNDIMRADKTALEAALNAYMYFVTGGTQTGQPRQGSSRPYFQDAAPTTRLDGDHFDSTDLGTPWIDSNSTIDNQFNILTAADGAGTNTWTPISTEVIAFILAQTNTWAEIQTFSKSPVFTLGIVANDSYITGRNNADDGNIDIAKVNTSDGITMGALTTLPDGSLLAAATEKGDTARAISDKAYADFQDDGTTVFNTSMTAAETWQDLDLSSYVGSKVSMVFLEVTIAGTKNYLCKPKGYGGTYAQHNNSGAPGVGMFACPTSGYFGYVMCVTDSSGVIQHASTDNSTTVTVKLVGFK